MNKQISDYMSRMNKKRKNRVGGFKDPKVQKKIREIKRAKREAADKAVEGLR